MMHKILYYLTLLALCSCSYIETLNEEGATTSKELNVSFYNGIKLMYPYEIVLIENNDPKIILAGKNYLMEGFMIHQKDSMIILDHQKKTFVQKENMITLYMYSPDFRSIELNAPSVVKTDEPLEIDYLDLKIKSEGSFSEVELDLKCEKLSFSNFGSYSSGSQKFSGSASKVNFNIEGCMNISANNLKCQEASVTHRSIGKCLVCPQRKLSVNIFSSGNTYYSGNPEITVSKTKTLRFTPTGAVLSMDSVDVAR